MEKRRVSPFTDVTFTNLTPESAEKIFRTQAVFHPERDICCITIEDGNQRRATFNPRSCVKHDMPPPVKVIKQMAEANRVIVLFNSK